MYEFHFAISSPVPPNRNWGSVFHGILIERLPAPWPERLHGGGVRIYSQWVEPVNEHRLIWHIHTLEDTLGEAILRCLAGVTVLTDRHHHINLQIISRQVRQVGIGELFDEVFYAPDVPKGLLLQIRTPAAHKNGDRYVILPSVEQIGRGLCKRVSEIYPDFALNDFDAQDQVLGTVSLSRYRLNSCTYGVEGSYIMGYEGSLELHFHGSEEERQFADVLFRFAPWCGIGVKTALGMGGCLVSPLGGKGK